MDKKRQRVNNSFKRIGTPRLEFSDQEIAYISNPADCQWRNDLLRRLNVGHICDAYACVGGDTVQFMSLEPLARIDAIQIVNNQETSERFARLRENTLRCRHLNRSTAVHDTSISEFIGNGGCNTVDFLYCDPPWTTLDGRWYTCDELIENLRNDVAEPLAKAGATPKYVCFKVPPNWEEFQNVLAHFPQYEILKSGVFHFHGYWMHVIKSV